MADKKLSTKAVINKEKTSKRYKVSYGEFKSQNEAITKAIEATRKGFNCNIELTNSYYSICYGEYEQDDAEKLIKRMKKKGLEATAL